MNNLQKFLIYDNFIGIKCLTTMILEEIPNALIYSFSNKGSINFNSFDYDNDYINIIHISSFDSYSVQLIESEKISRNIVIITDIPINIYFNRFSKFNIIGYIDRNTIQANTIKDLFYKIHNNKIYISDEDRDLLLGMRFDSHNSTIPTNSLDKLSLQEYKVMRNLLAGKSINEIAIELNLHKSSISTYKKRIFNKLAVKNMYELNLIVSK